MMSRVRLFLSATVLILGAVAGFCGRATATGQTPTASFCEPFEALSGVYLYNWEPILEEGIGCGPQYGDLFLDGPLQNPIPSPSGLTLTIPANIWVAQSQRVVTTSTNVTLTNNATNYVWLNCNACSGFFDASWQVTTSSSPPHTYSTLMYMALTSGGIVMAYTPTWSNVALASGLLTIYGESNASGYNQGVIGAQGSQLVLYSSVLPATIGGTSAMLALDQASSCIDSSATSTQLFQFRNDDNNSPLLIGCSTNTSDVMTPAITVNGNSVFAGPITVNSGITNGGLASSTSSALCGGNTAQESQCFTGLPVPLAATSALALTSSIGPTTSTPAWNLTDSNLQCDSGGTYAAGYVVEIQLGTIVATCAGNVFLGDSSSGGYLTVGNAAAPGGIIQGDIALGAELYLTNGSYTSTITASAASAGAMSFSNALKVPNINDTGLASSTSEPLCGGNTTGSYFSQCSNSEAARCGDVDPSTGMHVECGVVSASGFTCAASAVCTIGTFTFTTAFADTNYQCTADQYGSSTTYANRSLILGFGAKSSDSSISVIAAAPVGITSGISVNVSVICTE